MTDIVERLRKMAICVYLATEKGPADDLSAGLREAADEIERLQAAPCPCPLRLLLAKAEAEIERLRAELGQVREILNDREAEIGRLREPGKMTDIVARLRALARDHQHHRCSYSEAADEIERLRTLLDITKGCLDDAEAEVERLRALALKFVDEQTEANADALRAACEVRQ